MTIPRSGFFKPGLETAVWSLADWVKNLIEKKWPGLSDSDMVTGRLRIIQEFLFFFILVFS